LRGRSFLWGVGAESRNQKARSRVFSNKMYVYTQILWPWLPPTKALLVCSTKPFPALLYFFFLHCRARAEIPGAYDFSMAASKLMAPSGVISCKGLNSQISTRACYRSARASYPRFSIWKFGNGFWCLGKKMRIDLGLNIHSPNIYHNSYADYISDHGGQFVVITSSFQA